MGWPYISDVEHDLSMNGVEETCECGEPLELRFIGIKEWIFYCPACKCSLVKPPVEIKKRRRS